MSNFCKPSERRRERTEPARGIQIESDRDENSVKDNTAMHIWRVKINYDCNIKRDISQT